MASFFELYNKALIVTSLEITSPSVKSYNIILNNQSLKEQLIATGKFLIASGASDSRCRELVFNVFTRHSP